MPSRIKDLGGGSIGAGNGSLETVRGGKPLGPATPGGGASAPPRADSVHITDSARALAALSQAIQAVPDVDAGRVANLQQAVAGGSYRIDAGRIAARLLQIEQDLGGPGA